MVRATARKAVAFLTGKPKKQKPEQRILIVLKLKKGTYVLEREAVVHQFRHHYKTEAVKVFAEAKKVFHEAFDFHVGDVTAPKNGVFQGDSFEWHPVIFWLQHFDDNLLDCAELKGLQLTAIQNHQFYNFLRQHE